MLKYLKSTSFKFYLSIKPFFILADHRGGGSHPYQASPQQGMYMILQIDASECQQD
jgi:hypothetical protein